MDQVPLTGGRVTPGVVRVGATVRRPLSANADFAQACLRHLETVGFAGTPRFLGVDEQGREVLSYLPGAVPADLGPYADASLIAAAALLRRFHDATATMPAVRASGFPVGCHNDWAPTNAVFDGDLPYGLIDFATLRPGERLWDLGYSAFTWLDLGNENYSAPEQQRRLTVFVAGYAHPEITARAVAVHALARQAALAASAKARGLGDIAAWASQAAEWTALYLVEPLLPTGYCAPDPPPR